MSEIINPLSNLPLLKVGDKAPDFSLVSNEQAKWRLSDFIGTVVTLLFYPQNETLVCTKQLCSVRDNWHDYLETKAKVVGISPGTVDQHNTFSSNHRLPLPLLADDNREITRIYGQHWLFPIQLTRAIIIVDAKGLIRCRRIMLRAFRPTDRSVLASIYAARTDALHENFDRIVKESKTRNKTLIE